MEDAAVLLFRTQLLDRRSRLEAAAATLNRADELQRLLHDVDAALHRITDGSFGRCKTCGDTIESDRLLADPLTELCLDHLSPTEQRVLEQDLALAGRIQRELLPKPHIRLDGWEIAYRYEPFGAVSGDYCDLIRGPSSDGYFLLGDVAGKGVAAAMLMSHLSAMMRALVSLGLSVPQLVERASHVFCESTLPMHYATLVCGRASASGEIELCNAGHPPPLLIRGQEVRKLDSTGLPVGMFCDEHFSSHTVRLESGDLLLLYTDGVIEAQNPEEDEFGIDRLAALACSSRRGPAQLVDECVRELGAFRGGRERNDDVTIFALARA